MSIAIALMALQAVAAPDPAAPLAALVDRPHATTRPTVRAGVSTTSPAAVANVRPLREIAVPPSATPRPSHAQALAAVRAEWPRYDTRRTGRLGPLEFSTWVMQANGGHVAPAGVKGAAGIKPVSAMNATARAFARADANHDGGVTPDEMADFLIR